jgi:hypothetical protein
MPNRKEVKTMKYSKPEVAVLGPAIAHIQGVQTKPSGAADSEVNIKNSNGAYEADE